MASQRYYSSDPDDGEENPFSGDVGGVASQLRRSINPGRSSSSNNSGRFLDGLKTSTVIKKSSGDNTGSRVLGMEMEGIQYQNSMLALVDPRAYAQNRHEAFEAVKAEVDRTFRGVFEEMTTAGMSEDMAKQAAIQAAARERENRLRGFYLRFPDSANAISTGRLKQESTAEYGTGITHSKSGPRRKYKRKSKK